MASAGTTHAMQLLQLYMEAINGHAARNQIRAQRDEIRAQRDKENTDRYLSQLDAQLANLTARHDSEPADDEISRLLQFHYQVKEQRAERDEQRAERDKQDSDRLLTLIEQQINKLDSQSQPAAQHAQQHPTTDNNNLEQTPILPQSSVASPSVLAALKGVPC